MYTFNIKCIKIYLERHNYVTALKMQKNVMSGPNHESVLILSFEGDYTDTPSKCRRMNMDKSL